MAESILTPQQELFLASYTNPNSPTFGNALQSGLKAGYSQEYSESITTKNLAWLAENVGDMKLLEKAEKVLNDTLEMSDEVALLIDGRPLGVSKRDPALTKIKQDTAKFIAETVGKKRYSKKSPLTDDDNQPITVKIIQFQDVGSNSPSQV